MGIDKKRRKTKTAHENVENGSCDVQNGTSEVENGPHRGSKRPKFNTHHLDIYCKLIRNIALEQLAWRLGG